MTRIGKVFVVLNFLLSLFFVGTAIMVVVTRLDLEQARRDARKDVDVLTAQQNELLKKKTDLDAKLKQEETRYTRTKDENAATQKKLQTQIEELTTELNRIRAEIDQRLEETRLAHAQQKEQVAEVKRLLGVESQQKDQIAKLNDRQFNLENELRQATNLMLQAKARDAQLAAQLRQLEAVRTKR
jgi:chromosome segregation ATPase